MSKIIWMLLVMTMASFTLTACQNANPNPPINNWGSDGS